MSPEAQRIAIAEACNWTKIGRGSVSWDGSKTDLHGNGPKGYCELPNYLNDLNAMHEAEKTLLKTCEAVGVSVYYRQLVRMCENNPALAINATAAQRAEAFLRTIGKWQDGGAL